MNEVLKGQAALVTGASQGIGLATAIALAEAGASVAFNYRRDPRDATDAVEKLSAAGRRAILLAGDVADEGVVERLVNETVAAFGRLDIAVSNAAYSDREPFYEANMEGFRRTIDVTMWSAFHLARAAARQMIAQRQKATPAPGTSHAPAAGAASGSIVIISSPHAYVPIPRSMAYNMSKAAIDQMARTAAIELVEHKIRVNVVTPGWIDTPGERKFASDETIQSAAEKLPWRRLGAPTRSAAASCSCAIRPATILRAVRYSSMAASPFPGGPIAAREFPSDARRVRRRGELNDELPAARRKGSWHSNRMSEYLLPCSCGRSTKVSAAQAGGQVRCECGALLDVPTLRGLSVLEGAAPDSRRRGGAAWGNRHRVALVLLVVGGVILAAAARLAMLLPPAPPMHSSEEFEDWATRATPEQVFERYNNFQKGLVQTVDGDQAHEHRVMLLWAMRACIALGTICLVLAALVIILGRRPRLPEGRR